MAIVTAADKQKKSAESVAAQANADFARAAVSVQGIAQLIVVIVKVQDGVRAARVGAPAHKGITTTNARTATEKELFGTTTNGAYMQEITAVNARFAKERAMRAMG